MDPFTMVVAIVLIATIGNVLRERAKAKGSAPTALEDGEARALREEVTMLRDRVKVLERIAVEKNDTLTQQIEELRDR
ncbi:hypothetical protein [Sphingomicrobium sediminis]|uniref:Uncharacterized protein n=1 Tax=Sphingomicrobium sediminis TaxID=2950949 RepID=A0A9X2EFD6_9SPHN|nr:hypothetical protein [Sphingomicrobium sediminis]MCM8556923.1 hypothetical protein [Sphingomicrobium sediminis]